MGQDSPAAADGDQRFYPVPLPGVTYIAFNSSRPTFADPRVR
jgi:ABC-type oligopeptide transport system substrate-binding subunit